MDRGVQHPQERQDSNNTLLLTVPPRTLLVLCGAAGSGKSTFAEKLIETHQHLGFKPTMIVSSDTCRAIVCDDENNQQANRDAFDLFHFTLHKRMFQSRFSIADSTALQAHARLRLLEVAQRHNYFTSLLIFNISSATCAHPARTDETAGRWASFWGGRESESEPGAPATGAPAHPTHR